MDDWRMQPKHTYRSRPSPYPIYPNHSMEQHLISRKFSSHPPYQARTTRSMPYSSPTMYPHSYQYYYPSQHQMYYPIPNKPEDCPSSSSTSYHPSVCSNSYLSAQQLTPISQEYPIFSSQSSQIFPSPPYQGEFNGTTEFGVPYHYGQPSSVNSLTDALCPSGDSIDRQLTPGPPSVGTPRVAQHQYSFPQTPSTPTTTSRFSNEQNIDELTAFLQDPVNIYLPDDFTSTLIEDIEVLANTYLGGNRGNEQVQQSPIDNDLDYDIILNYLCSDDLISTVCKN